MGHKLGNLIEIAKYLQWSEDKVLRVHKSESLPISKVLGRWESHTDVLDDWCRSRAKGRRDIFTVVSSRKFDK